MDEAEENGLTVLTVQIESSNENEFMEEVGKEAKKIEKTSGGILKIFLEGDKSE